MQRIHLIGGKDVPELSGGVAHAVLPAFLANHVMSRFFRDKRDKGDDVFFISSKERIKKTTLKKEFKLYGVNKAVVFMPRINQSIVPMVDSLVACGCDSVIVLNGDCVDELYAYVDKALPVSVGVAFVSVPSVEGNGFGRFRRVRKMVTDHLLNLSRPHYLWELENPAELALYARLLLPRVRTAFSGFMSARCYIDSMHGIEYSPSIGLFHSPIAVSDLAGMTYAHSQQKTRFFLNEETIRGFVHGRIGSGLCTKFETGETGVQP